MTRRFIWLAIAIIAAIALYTFGWFYAADRLVSEAQAALDRASSGGNRAVCEQMDARGYPFRIGLFCDAVFVERRTEGIDLDAGALRSAAQVYSPRQVVAELDAPVRLNLPRLLPLHFTWGSLQASARLALPMPERTSLVAQRLNVEADTPGVGNTGLLGADRAEVHLRPAGANLEVGLRTNALTMGPLLTAGQLPPVSGVADFVLLDGMARFGARDFDPHGARLDIRRVEIAVEGGGNLAISGPLSVRDDGLVDADLQVKASDAAALLAIVAGAFPEISQQMLTLGAGLAALGPDQPLPLRIREGVVTLGFITLGQIPPI
ncbi:MAG: DUF2125 domain-containing protein [Rhizobiaceae bacterium]|nr:DUF2125 domain-containing protein [Rhizobiaceae bacterium]